MGHVTGSDGKKSIYVCDVAATLVMLSWTVCLETNVMQQMVCIFLTYYKIIYRYI